MQELKAIEILRTIKEGNFIPYLNENLIYIDEAINELEQYEQNFKQKVHDENCCDSRSKS